MGELRRLLSKGHGLGGIYSENSRAKRANPLFMGMVGGIFGAITTELFSRVIPENQVAAAAKQTEKILDNIGERTNALDVNQKRIHILINQIQQQLSNKQGMVEGNINLSNIHIQINSVLIHINDHLGYLYRLLAGGDTDTGINLAISEEEQRIVFEKTTNLSNDNNISPGKPVRHGFQFLAPEILCVILDVPIKPSISSMAAIEATAFPSIQNGILWTPIPRHRLFIQFSGGFFVETNRKTFEDCLQNGICTGMQPLQYADDTAGCHIRQHFGETKIHCRGRRMDLKRFLLQTGDKLMYTLLEPITLRMIWQRKTEDRIKTLDGRGVIKIPVGCAARTNKAILSKPNPAHLMIVKNTSLFQKEPLKIAKSNSIMGEQMHIKLISTD